MDYSIRVSLDCTFVEAVTNTKVALIEFGFGILTEIDLKETLKKKLDVYIDNYIILGVCHPSSAYEALKVEQEIGLLLPCNIIIYEYSGRIMVSAIRPSIAMNMVENNLLNNVAKTVEEKLICVINSLI